MLFLNYTPINAREQFVNTPVIRSLVLSVACASFAGITNAAPDIELAPRLSTEDTGAEFFPNANAIAFPVGAAGFYPSGAVRLSHVDNLYFESDEKFKSKEGEEENQDLGGPTQSTMLQVIPKLDLVAEGSKTLIWTALRGDLRSHDGASSNANKADFRLRNFAHVDVNNRNRIDLEASYFQLSEELGIGRTGGDENLNTDFSEAYDSPDSYGMTRLGFAYSYGNPRSRGELVFGGTFGSLKYLENKENITNPDRDMSILWGRFSYKLTGKTTLFSRFSRRQYIFDGEKNENRGDRDVNSLTFGSSWLAGGVWYGDAALSYVSWDYALRDESDNALEASANLFWDIKSYSTLNLFVRQFVDDEDDNNKLQMNTNIGARWNHAWSDRFSTTGSLYASNDTFEGETIQERTVLTLEGRLRVRRWMNTLLGISTDDLSSSDNNSSRNLVYVGLEGNL